MSSSAASPSKADASVSAKITGGPSTIRCAAAVRAVILSNTYRIAVLPQSPTMVFHRPCGQSCAQRRPKLWLEL